MEDRIGVRGATIAWGVAGALGCGLLAPLEPILLEEGMLLQVAERLVRGEHLFVDVVSFTGPLPFELLALLFRVFGEEIYVARAAVAMLHGSACAVIHALASRLGGRTGAAAAAAMVSAPTFLFPMLSIYFYTTVALDLALIAAGAALAATRRTAFAWLTGALIAAVALCKQTLGLGLAAFLLPTFVIYCPAAERWRRLLAAGGGGALVTVLTLGLFAWRGGAGAMIEQMVLLPLSLGSTFDLPFPNLWPPGRFSPELTALRLYYVPQIYWLTVGPLARLGTAAMLVTQLLYALPFLVLGATIALRARGPLRAPLAIHGAVLAALMTNLFPRTDWGHLVFVLPAAVVQAVLLCSALSHRARAGSGRLGVALGRAWIAALLASALGLTALFHAVAAPANFGPRVPQKPLRTSGVPLSRVIAYVREHAEKGEPIFVPRAEPLIYFATETTNPTPYSGVLPAFREAQEAAILEALERVRFVVMSEIDQPVYTYYSDELPAVQEYLERHFQVAPPFREGDATWLVVLARGGDRGATAIDLVDIQERARRWIRDRDGLLQPAPRPPRLAARHNRRPLALPLGARGGRIEFEIEPPAGAAFEAEYGLFLMRSHRTFRHPDGVRLSVSVVVDGRETSLTSVEIAEGEARRDWGRIEADLSPYAGRTVALRIDLVAETPIGPRQRLAWLGSPRIHVPASRPSSRSSDRNPPHAGELDLVEGPEPVLELEGDGDAGD